GAARAAIQGKRFQEALDTLAALRAIDPTAAGLAELTEQAARGHSAPPAATAYESSDATVFITPELLDAAQSAASGARQSPSGPWGSWGPRGVLVGVVVFVLAVIVALIVVLKAW